MIKKINLKKLLTGYFFKTTLIPLVVIEITLLVMYFGISSFMVEKNKDSLYSQIQSNLEAILSKEALNIDFQLKQINNLSAVLQRDQEKKFEEKDKIVKALKNDSPKFTFAPNNVYYKTNDNGGSSLFYGTSRKMGQEQLDKALFTETFDELLKYSVNSNELVVASYFNSYDNMNRLYPFIPKVYEQFDPAINMEDYNFYYEADMKHNPSRNPVWTGAYLDPAGQGWMISCIVPIYSKDFLEGVTGLDVTIDKFVKNILNLELPWNAQGLLVDKDGTILAMPPEVEKILELKELKEHQYTDTIKETNLKPEELNIIKNKKIYPYFKDFVEDNRFMSYKNIHGEEYIISQKIIEQTGWKLFVIVNKNTVFKPIKELENFSTNIGKFAIAGMVLFYIIFFILIYKRIQTISKDISEPISNLADMTKDFSLDLKTISVKDNNIEEIDMLSRNFKDMTEALREKTISLETLNNSLEERVKEEVEKNKEKEQALLYQSRLAQMGEMISMIAHQWRQPLASISTVAVHIKLRISLMDFDLDSKEGKEDFLKFVENELDDIEQLTENLTTTIDDFRDFYKPNKEAVLTDIKEPIQKSLSILKPEIDKDAVDIIENYKEGMEPKELFKSELTQVFLNIIKNAIDTFEINDVKNPQITIDVKEEGENTLITIGDNAGGIPESVIDKIFDPYFSTKDERNGTGLGLYMSKLIIEKHHKGSIAVKVENGHTYFSITI